MSGTVTTQPGPQRRTPLHPRLTVARAGSAERPRLVDALGGEAVGSEDLAAAAAAVALERSEERAARRARLDGVVERRRGEADEAADRVADLDGLRRRLLEGADWAEAAVHDLPGLQEAVAAARANLEERLAAQRAARAGLDRVVEQRAAAATAMEDADRQLADLVGVGMDETSLRRELEAAGHAVRAAQEAHAASVQRIQDVEEEQAQVEARIVSLRADLATPAAGRQVSEADVQLVRGALADWDDAARHAGPDPDAQALADAFADLGADLADLQARLGPRPAEADLQAAEARATAAAQELDRIDAEAASRTLAPADRAELEAAHEAVLDAERGVERRIGAGGARKRLEAARAHEQELLTRFGFATYLEVTLSGGRAVTSSSQRLAAERTYLAAKAHRERLLCSMQPSAELEYLESERARLLGHVVGLIGYDPGDDPITPLRAQPLVPRQLVAALRDALLAVDGLAEGVDLPTAARVWLQGQDALAEARRTAGARNAALAAELEQAVTRSAQLVDELAEARSDELRAAEELDLAGRSVGTFETELTVRAGEENTRLKRFAAAEQLRHQIEALTTTLTRAEHAAREALDRADEAVATADHALDRAEDAVGAVSRRATELGSELSPERRPHGEIAELLHPLAAALRDRAEERTADLHEAEADLAAARARVDSAAAEAAEAGDGAGAPLAADVVDGFTAILRRRGDTLIVLDEPFAEIDPAVRPTLLEALVAPPAPATIVLLTADPDALGWAIELPADTGSVIGADSLLNLGRLPADNQGRHSSVVELPGGEEDPRYDPTAPTGPARGWAGRR